MTLGPPGPLNATVKYRGSTKNDRARARMSSCSQEKRGWGKFLSQRQREWTKFAKYPASRHRLNTIRILWINLRPNSRQTGLCKRRLLHDKTNWDIPMTRPKDSSFIPSNPPFFCDSDRTNPWSWLLQSWCQCIVYSIDQCQQNIHTRK